MTISRKVLQSLPAPEQWPTTPERFAWFRWWLGYRFDRPSLERYEEDHLKKPIEDALSQLAQTAPQLLTTFFQTVKEIRVSGPSRTEQPWDFQLMMLTGARSLTSNQAEAIEVMRESITSRLSLEPILLDEDIIVTSLQECSVADYRQTWLLPLDHIVESRGESDVGNP